MRANFKHFYLAVNSTKYNYWHSLVLCFILSLATWTSCAKDPELTYRSQVERGVGDSFKLLSVVPHNTGRSIELDLNMHFDTEGMRALTFEEDADSLYLKRQDISAKEQLHIFLRKEGDTQSHCAATLTWEGREGDKLFLEGVKISLPEGYNINPGEKWYVMGILGGELDVRSLQVRLGGTEESISVDKPNAVDVPYIFPWQALRIDRQNAVSIPETTLQVRGALLRLHFYSDLMEDYDLHGLRFISNALQAQGVFAPFATENSSTQLGKTAPWQPTTTTQNNEPISWEYRLNTALPIPAGSKHEAGKTIYLWVMPTVELGEDRQSDTKIEMLVRSKNMSEVQSLESYHKRKHRRLQEGRSYRLSNLLTSPLVISEVYYQYAPKGLNPNAPNEHQVYSIVEIYNPTLSPISLANYALVRTVQDNGSFGYFLAGKGSVVGNVNLEGATLLPLADVTGVNPADRKISSPFSKQSNDRHYNGSWYKPVYGEGAVTLRPGTTALIGAGGYVNTNHKPSANIERFNPKTYKGASTRELELPYLPMAGMQADSARQNRYRYMQFMVALNNGKNRQASPNPSEHASVLQVGNGQGLGLVRATLNDEDGYDFELVDITSPLGSDAEQSAKFLGKLTEAGISTDHQAAGSYSLVRKSGLLASKHYNAEDWTLSESENDGVKSLGSRDYVAGLSPFKPNYTGYDRNNNPNSLPFWRGSRGLEYPAKWWGKGAFPESGFNYPASSAPVGIENRGIKIAVASGSATREDAGDVFAKSYDGSYETRFWAGKPLPVTLTYNFAQPERLSHILYRSWDGNHSINAYDIRVVYDDGSQKEIAMPPLGAPHRSTTEISWEGISEKPIKTVNFIVKSVGGGNDAVSFYEMEFFKVNDAYVDPSALFKDLACTELREGITYKEIMAFPNGFYRDIARMLYHKSYPSEFRIADYKAWTHPNYQWEINKNQFPYSLMDNPTGMYLQANQEVIVLVGDTKGHNISLMVIDLERTNDDPNYSYNFSQTYPLKPGFNRIRIRREGTSYIRYHVNELDVNHTAHPPIRVHFPIGTALVNGYYDAYKAEHQGRWRELLRKAQGRYFDVLGKHAHLVYSTDGYRRVVQDPKPLVDIYDKIVYEEMSMMGVLMNNKARMFRNRMAYTSSRVGLYAFLNYVAIPGDNVDHTKIPYGSWGLAHETGHMNQTTGFNWGGLIEVSTNLHSYYIEHNIFKGTSRFQRPTDDEYGSRGDSFTTAWNALLETPERPVTAESRGSASLIPFVQLQLYFGDIKGMNPTEANGHTGFLPRMYDNLRTANYNGKDDGAQQVEITYHVSRAAGYDLTKFFERWGFYRPATALEHFNTYNKSFTITVRQSDIDNVKARIKALKLPEPPEGFALEYITVLNKELFRSYKPIQVGTVVKNGQSFTLAGWRNVAAWEIRDSQGKLLYTETGGNVPLDATYTVTYPSILRVEDSFGEGAAKKIHRVYTYPAWDDNYRLYAIDVKGQKTQAYPTS